jgi:hypothetical protein
LPWAQGGVRDEYGVIPKPSSAQVIGLLKEAYEKAGLQLPMAPYGVIATDYECGIIEVRGAPL